MKNKTMKATLLAMSLMAVTGASAQTYNVGSSDITDVVITQGNTIYNGSGTFTGVASHDMFGYSGIGDTPYVFTIFNFSNLAAFNPATQQVTSATLMLTLYDGYPTPSPGVVDLAGITTAYNPSTVLYGDVGAQIESAASLASFGTGLGGSLGTPLNLDITTALQGYLSGTYTGLALRMLGAPLNDGNAACINFNATESATASFRPTLTYTIAPIPEPSVPLLAGSLGALFLVRRRRA